MGFRNLLAWLCVVSIASSVVAAAVSGPGGLRKFQDGVFIDWSKRQVELAGEVVLREGQLELFACSPNSKEHESIVRVLCQPMHVFQAMGLIGLTPGKPPLYNNRTKEIMPATGERLDILVRWTARGQTHTVPIWEWIHSKKKDQQAVPIEWVFSGSMVTPEGPLLADFDGTVITVVDFESALVSVPASHTSSNESLWLDAYTEKIPPVDTPVTVILKAARGLRVEMDRFGGLQLNGAPTSLREVVAAGRQQASEQGDGPSTAVIRYGPEISSIQAEQLAMSLRRAGVAEVRLEGVDWLDAAATRESGGRTSLEEQGEVVLQVMSDLGKVLPTALDRMARSAQEKYTRLNDQAQMAGRAAAGAAKAFEAMQGAGKK